MQGRQYSKLLVTGLGKNALKITTKQRSEEERITEQTRDGKSKHKVNRSQRVMRRIKQEDVYVSTGTVKFNIGLYLAGEEKSLPSPFIHILFTSNENHSPIGSCPLSLYGQEGALQSRHHYHYK